MAMVSSSVQGIPKQLSPLTTDQIRSWGQDMEIWIRGHFGHHQKVPESGGSSLLCQESWPCSDEVESFPHVTAESTVFVTFTCWFIQSFGKLPSHMSHDGEVNSQ